VKIKLRKSNDNWYFAYINERCINQKQYNYMFKYLDFDKLNKKVSVFFYNKEIDNWFCKTYTNHMFLETIYKESPEGYEWLKENWGKGVFKLWIYYIDKQELKTITNRVINVVLKIASKREKDDF